MEALPENIKEKIESVIQQGNALKQKSKYRDALKQYTDAFQELPNSKEDWDVSIALFLARLLF